MNAPGQGKPLEFRLRSGRDLMEALWSADVAVRLATLAAIRNNPQTALAFRTGDDRDVIDELRAIVRENSGSLVRTSAAAALFVFDDGRSLDEAMAAFAADGDADMVVMAGQRIGRGPDAAALDFFLPYLWKPGDALRSRTAARMLAGRCGLKPGGQLRVALLAGETGAEPPSLSAETLPLWMEELCGDLRYEARGLLMICGREKFLFLKENWPVLDPGTKAWLVSWGAVAFQEEAVELLFAAFSETDYELRLAALEAVPRYVKGCEVFDAAVRKVSVGGCDKRWTVAAIRAGAPVEDLRDRVFTEEDTDIRIALIARLGEDVGDMEELARLLRDEEWRVRAAATEALCAMGETALDVVLRLIKDDNLSARTAAAQILLRLGKNEVFIGKDDAPAAL